MTRICFVCLGNICRSPMAAVVMRSLVAADGLADEVQVDSAGTGDWHVGNPADARALSTLAARGYDGSAHRARQFTRADIDHYDLVLALDHANLASLHRLAPDRPDRVRLLTSFDPDAEGDDVPDPYYDGPEGFATVLTMVERACRGLLDEIRSGRIGAG